MKDENQPPQPWIDPALEARIVASVLGETSAFEAAEIERLVAAHPELALFKRRLETTHALVEIAHRPENPKIQLSPERRRKLLETIGVPAVAPPKKIRALATPSPWWSSPLLIRAAACLIMTGLAVALLSSISLKQTTPKVSEVPEEESGLLQSETVAITVPQSQIVATMPSLSGDTSKTESLGLPPSASAPMNLALNGAHTHSGKTIVTMGVVTEVTPVLENAQQNMAQTRLEEPALELSNRESDLADRRVVAQADKDDFAIFRKSGDGAVPLPKPAATQKNTLWKEEAPADFSGELAFSRTEYAKNKPDGPRPASMDAETDRVGRDAAQEDVLHKLAEEQPALDAPAPERPNLRTRIAERDENQPVEGLTKEAQKLEVLATLEKASEDLAVVNQSAVAQVVIADPLRADQHSAGTAISANAVDFDGFINYGSPIVTVRSGERAGVKAVREFTYPPEFDPPAQGEDVKRLLVEADDFANTGRFDLATKRYAQTLAADPHNVAARRGMENVNAAKSKYYASAYDEARGRMLMVDAGWSLPVRKFDIGASTIIEQPGIDQSGKAQINRKLDEIIIPRIDFQDVTVREALEFLKSRGKQLDTAETDPAKKGVNVVLNLPKDAPESQARITLGLTDIPLRAAFNYVAAAANLKTKIEPHAVSLVFQSTPADVLITKQYKVPPDFIPVSPAGSISSAAKQYFETVGVTFPPGATAYYIASSNTLIVKNTASNLDLVDTLVEKSAAPAKAPTPQDEILAAKQPISTFSLHVSDVSFQLAKDALERGAKPDPERIRAEEFYNAFDYNDPAPGAGEEVACRIEQSAHPFLQQRNLVRIAVKVAAAGRAAGQPLRLTILLDTSGSMEREDRALSVRRALQSLVSLLGPNDRVTLIGFARTPRLLAEDVPGDQGGKLLEAADRTPSQGGTNLEEALALASELALKHRHPDGQNRIVLLTDGAANLGNANPERLAAQIDKTRQQGVSFDACGVGAKGLNDEILEALTRKGDGRYYFLNKPEDADEGFARQLAGAFRPAAENVKVQVVFNPARVARYRLIGFEKHLLKQEDFRNDKVQAAELSAEEAGVALYQVEPVPDGSGELGEVFVRFRDPATGRMVERSWTMPYEERTPSFDQASPSLQLAATAALLAENLRGGEQIDLNVLAPVLNGLRARYGEQPRVGDLLRMFERVRR